MLCRTIAAALQCTYADDTGGGDGDDGGGGGSSALMAKFLAMRAKMDYATCPRIPVHTSAPFVAKYVPFLIALVALGGPQVERPFTPEALRAMVRLSFAGVMAASSSAAVHWCRCTTAPCRTLMPWCGSKKT